MNFATLQRISLPPHLSADAFIAEHGTAAAQKVSEREVRLLKPFKLTPMDQDEAKNFQRGLPLKPPAPVTIFLLLLAFLVFGENSLVASSSEDGARPVPTPQEAQVLPDPKGYQSMGWILAGIGGLLVIYNQARTALRKDAPAKIEQPIQIEHITQYVRMADFNSKFQQIEKRFEGIEKQISDQVQRTDKYIHEMRHELRNSLNGVTANLDDIREAALSSVGKSHSRIDALAEGMGELRGEVKNINEQVGDVRRLLITRGGGGK